MADSINIEYSILDQPKIDIEYLNQAEGAAYLIMLSGGASGLSAYDIAVKNGFVGTEAEWLDSLQGSGGGGGGVKTYLYPSNGNEVIENGAAIWATGLLNKIPKAILLDNARPFQIADDTNTLETDIIPDGTFVYIPATGQMRYAPRLFADQMPLMFYTDA